MLSGLSFGVVGPKNAKPVTRTVPLILTSPKRGPRIAMPTFRRLSDKLAEAKPAVAKRRPENPLSRAFAKRAGKKAVGRALDRRKIASSVEEGEGRRASCLRLASGL